MQRLVLVTQKAPRTADVPLLQYSDTTVDVQLRSNAEKTPQRQPVTKYNDFQMDKKLRYTKQNDTEVTEKSEEERRPSVT